MNKNLSKIILIIILLSSFTGTKKTIIGLYGKCNDGYMACKQLELKSDSTFEYYTFFDVGGSSIKKGTWEIDKDTLILNTFYQPQFEKGYRILDSTYSSIKEIYCLDRDSIPLTYGRIILNNNDTILLDENGKALYESQINNIQIFGLGGQNNTFTIKSLVYSKIVFFIDDFVCHNPEYLTNEKLIIKGNSLKDYYHCHSRFADKGLKKIKTKDKKF